MASRKSVTMAKSNLKITSQWLKWTHHCLKINQNKGLLTFIAPTKETLHSKSMKSQIKNHLVSKISLLVRKTKPLTTQYRITLWVAQALLAITIKLKRKRLNKGAVSSLKHKQSKVISSKKSKTATFRWCKITLTLSTSLACLSMHHRMSIHHRIPFLRYKQKTTSMLRVSCRKIWIDEPLKTLSTERASNSKT